METGCSPGHVVGAQQGHYERSTPTLGQGPQGPSQYELSMWRLLSQTIDPMRRCTSLHGHEASDWRTRHHSCDTHDKSRTCVAHRDWQCTKRVRTPALTSGPLPNSPCTPA
eukprot:3755485-Heterocapsa_arctica.AAC.1